MKEYREFQEKIKNYLLRRYGKKWKFELESVTVNNGITKDCLMIQKSEGENRTVMNLMPFYNRYRQGMEMALICRVILKLLERDYPLAREQALLDFEQMKGRVVYRLVNAGLNRELLKTIPSIPFQDLAIVFALLLDSPEEGRGNGRKNGQEELEDEPKDGQEDEQENDWEDGRENDRELSCLIHYGHLNLWGISEEILYPLAMENTPRLLPLQCQHIVDTIDREIVEALPGDDPEMYVITNQEGVYGAAAVLYPDVLKTMAGRLGSDLLILPSSVHEQILVPCDKRSEEIDFWEMVADVNRTEVPPEDILSGTVYRYDRNEDRVTIAKRQESVG